MSIWPNLSGGESIDVLARLRGASKHDAGYRDEKQRLMQEFQFDPRTKGRAYSKGNRQKVALIAALAVPADLYIFDEPTSGLDPLMEVVFRREMARMKDAGATVLLSSHILSEVELLCDRVSIIRAGKSRRVGHAGRTAPPHPHRDLVRGDGGRRSRRGPGRARRVVRGRSRPLHDRQRPRWPRPFRCWHGWASRACACSRPRSRSYSCATTAMTCRQVRRTPASTPGRGAIAGRRPGDERLRHPAAAAVAPRPLAAADVDRRHGAAGVRHLRRRLRVVRHPAGSRRHCSRRRWRTPSSCCSAVCPRVRTRARSCCS